MNVWKRKSDECHYCANQKLHERKRSKLTIPEQNTSTTSTQSKPMIPVQGNFKCRGRGGKEIEFPPDDPIPLNDLQNSKPGVDVGKRISDQNHDQHPKMNFKPQTKQPELRTDPPYDNSCTSRRYRSGRATVSSRSDAKSEIRRSSSQPKPKFRASVGELSIKSETIPRTESVVNEHRYDFRSSDKLSLLSTRSDGQSSTDESSVTTCLTRSRYIRKVVETRKQAPRNSKLTSTSLVRRNRNSRSLVKESRSSRSLRTSNESVHDYLINVSEELQRERLLGKLDQSEQHVEKLNRPERFFSKLDQCDKPFGNSEQPDERGDRLKESFELRNMYNSSYTLGNHSVQKQTFQPSKSTKCTHTSDEKSFVNAGRTMPVKKDRSFWSRMFHIFSLGCWKTDINSTSPSVDQKSEANTISGSGESSSSESSSTSTGTTTVAAVASCGRRSDVRTRNDDDRRPVRSTTAIALSSRSSCSGDHKDMAAKLVESLKRFFSRHRKSDSDREPYEVSESTSCSASSEEDNSEPSSSAPLNPKQPSSLSPKQPQPIELTPKAPTAKNHRVQSTPESEGLDKRLLGDPAESPLSTENETSEAEIVDICPMHKQPI